MESIFSYILMPNNVEVFPLLIRRGIDLYRDGKWNLLLSLYPVYKHHWSNGLLKRYHNLIYISYKSDDGDYINIDDFKDIEIGDPNYEKFRYSFVHNGQVMNINFNAYSLLRLKLEPSHIWNIQSIPENIGRGIVHDGAKYSYLSEISNTKDIETINQYYLNIEREIQERERALYPERKEKKSIDPYYKFPKISLEFLNVKSQFQILSIFLKRQKCVITGGTGTGKTTQIPKLLWWFTTLFDGYSTFDRPLDNESFLFSIRFKSNHVVLSLPRKVLIKSLSRRLSKDLGFKSIEGSIVKPVFRHDDDDDEYRNRKPRSNTNLIISVNRLSLEQSKISSVLIIDEIHEHEEFSLITSSIALKRFNHLRNIVFMTATLFDRHIFQKIKGMVFIDKESKALYPIEVIENPLQDYKNIIITSILTKKLNSGQAMIIFKSSVKEVDKLYTDLYDKLKNKLGDYKLKFIKSYRSIRDLEEQIKNDEKDKVSITIFISTPILESSITVEKAVIVVDDCYFYHKHFLSGRTIEITKSMQKQRMGRVGRVGPGYYYPRKIIKNDIPFLKIDHEFLWPYIIYRHKYDIEYKDFLVQPTDKSRFLRTEDYMRIKGIEFTDKIFILYNKYPCNLIEYLKIYSSDNISIIKELEEYDNSQSIVKKIRISETLKSYLVRELNIKLIYLSTFRDSIRYRMVKEFEDPINSYLIVSKDLHDIVSKNPNLYLYLIGINTFIPH